MSEEKLKTVADVDAVVGTAKAAGLMISAEDFKTTQSELSDEELESVAGGTVPLIAFISFIPDVNCTGHPGHRKKK